ncbi:ribosomal RNA small subunit methyltransferase A [candidate division WWE3 bacterium]|uniref:Ribosomal RNA small subunit methyltransferase A n=1 Tax=candidate division WWE3 bacterium TaxID=2053526 RepID=A0A7X9DKA1_UNCKA|nr:ribosomal RNA small subunit methyltransferase A [candidate division WWE3 bacterium]
MYEAIKKLGQNFLTDKTIAERMVDSLSLHQNDTVIEIGSGLGIVTEVLAEHMEGYNVKVYAVEIDGRFAARLESMFVEREKLVVVEADILQWLPKFSEEGSVKVLGSLPFYITSPIIHSIVKMNNLPEKVVLLVQKEVGEKIAGSAPDTTYMSAFVQTFFDVFYSETVPRQKFKPEPNVDGAVLTMTRKRKLPLNLILKYEGFLHRGFSSPRKMLNKPFKKEELEMAGINPTIRPQNLSADQWFAFFRILHNIQDYNDE